MADYVRRSQVRDGTAALITSAGLHVEPDKVSAHTSIAAPSAIQRTEQTQVNASITSGSTHALQVLLGDVTHLGSTYLRLDLAAPAAAGAYYAYAGLNAIKQLTIRFGSEVLAEYPNYRAALKAMVRTMRPAQAEGVLDALGGAAPAAGALTVCIPLMIPGAGAFGGTPQASFLPLFQTRGSGRLQLDIVFGDAATLSATPAAGESITACNLVYQEGIFSDSDLGPDGFAAPLFLPYREYQSFPEVVVPGGSLPLVGGVGLSAFDLSGVVGTLSEVVVFDTSAVAATFGSAQAAMFHSSNLHIARLRIDGRDYWLDTGASGAERALESVLSGYGVTDPTAGTLGTAKAPFVPLSLYPALAGADFYGGLSTGAIRNLTLQVESTNVTAFEVCAVCVSVLALEGKKIVRKRA